jgi:hypothetical protein
MILPLNSYKRSFTFSVLLIAFPLLAFAQVDTAWVRRYPPNPGPGAYANGLALTLDAVGYVYVTGPYGSSFLYDYATLKYNRAGDTVWVGRYNGPADSDDVASAIAVDPSGNIYVTGGSKGVGTSDDFCTIKYDRAGGQKWIARYNGPANSQDIANAIAVDANKYVYVTGWSYGSGSDIDYATVKYDSLGNELWARRYNGPANSRDNPLTLAVDTVGNVCVTGLSAAGGGAYDYATIMYNGAGDTLWVRRYSGLIGGGGFNVARAVAVDAAGNAYVTGASEGFGTGRDFATIKYNGSGDTLWVRRYNGPVNGQDEAWALAVDQDGNVYVTGQSASSSDPADFATVKYDRNGDQRWVARYNGPGNQEDVAKHVAVDAQGNVYVAGRSIGLTPNGDYCTVKYDSLGNQLWVARYDGPANNYDDIFGLAVDDSGNVYVTGISDGNVAPVMCTIKYRQFVGVEGLTPSGVPLQFKLSQNAPNPWASGTRISYTLSHEAQVALRVYNPAGQLVRTLVDGGESAGFKQVAWDGRDDGGRRVPSGVYFYRLQAGAFSDTKKMVLIR